jgi:hypothetical protein
MGRGVIKFPNFQKIYIFKKVQNFKTNIFHEIKNNITKKIQNFLRILFFFFKILKFVYHESDIFLKIGFAEIPYINKGLLVYLVFSMGMGVNIPWVGGVDIPMVYRPPYPIQLLTFNAVYSWLYGPGQWMIDRGHTAEVNQSLTRSA